MRSEEDLIRTLRTASGHAEQPPGALAGTLAGAVAARRRTRRLRQRAQVALAAAAVVLVAGGTATVLADRGGPAEPAISVTTGPPANRAPKPQLKPAAEVWPQAVQKMPAKSADGWKYRLVTSLSPTEVLTTAESSFEKAGRLEVYDTATGATRVVGDMTAPEGVRGYFAQAVDVGEKYFVWWGSTPNNSDKWADFWIIPREGGKARRVGEVTGELSRVETVGVTDDSLVWSVRAGGVYRMPLTGGAPERIEGSDGLHLTTWPLAVGYAAEGERGAKNQNRLVNLETGVSATIPAPPGATHLACTAEWCFGNQQDRAFRQRLDGSDHEPLPEGLLISPGGDILGDRFVRLELTLGGDPTAHYIPAYAVYDPETGRIGGVHRQRSGGGASTSTGTSTSPTAVVYWDEDTKAHRECSIRTIPPGDGKPGPGPTREVCMDEERGGGKEFTVLNLAAVGAGS